MSERIFNNLTKGMIRKVNPLKKDQNFYNFALNITTDKNSIDRLTKTCENALENYYSLKDVDYVILNTLYLNKNEYIFFITNKTSDFSEIIYYKNNVIDVIYNNINLNFKASNVISSTYRTNYIGERLVYFVDGLNEDRVINIDRIDINDDINSLSITPIYNYSDVLDYDIVTGGSLLSGEYYILIEYIDDNGALSFYKDIVNGVPIELGNYDSINRKIITDASTQGVNFISEIEGRLDVTGTRESSISNKSINVILRDEQLDLYKSLNIYVIKMYDGSPEVYLRENVNISKTITISSLNTYELLGGDISEVIVNNILYNRSDNITQLNNRLILANTSIENYNAGFQEFANTISVGYEIEKEAFGFNHGYYGNYKAESGGVSNSDIAIINGRVGNSYSGESRSFSTAYYLGNTDNKNIAGKTFMRDEVYAIGVYFELKNGQFTDVYHVPGRKMNDELILSQFQGKKAEDGTVLTTSTYSNWDNRTITREGQSGPAWKMMNTAVEGMLGYYRCEETYPDGYGFPTDGEQNNGKSYIRHHRIPSDIIEPILETVKYPGEELASFTNKRYIKLKFEYSLPPDLIGIVKNVFFTFAKRDENNKKVASKGIVYRTRDFGGNIRNSENLNAPASFYDNNRSSWFYEFKSPDVDFKFKEFNISSNSIKLNAVLYGEQSYVSKAIYREENNSWNAPYGYVGSFLNSEGINPGSPNGIGNYTYSFKQEFGANRLKYAWVDSYNDLKQYNIEDILFIDNNGLAQIGSDTIRFEGNQNSSVFKLLTSTTNVDNIIFNGDDTYTKLISNLPTFGIDKLSNVYRAFWFNGEAHTPNLLGTTIYSSRTLGYDGNYKYYYDTTLYTTLLTNNDNIYSNLLQLEYNIGVNKDIIQGDSFIDYHHTKKGYSDLITNSEYRIIASYKEQERINSIQFNQIAGAPSVVTTTGNDMAVFESYITYPVETRINLRLRRKDPNNLFNPYLGIENNLSTKAFEEMALKQMTYELNSQYEFDRSLYPMYSNQNTLDEANSQSRRIGNRIVYSELQNNESRIDNFRVFKANNYKDIPTFKGDINKLFIKDNSLFAITRDSLYKINNTNNYLTSTSGTNITVGTGEFLGTDPEELVSLETGFAGTISKLSFNESKFGYLFVDSIRNKVILFDKNLNNLNINGLEEDFSINLFKSFPELNERSLDKPLLGYGILSGFDPETDRLFITKLDYKPTELMLDEFNSDLITIEDGLFYKDGELLDFSDNNYFENKSFTVTYDGINNTWISYHNYFPNYYIPDPNILVLKTDDIKKYGIDFTDKFIIDVNFNEQQGLNKVFDSIQFDVKSETINEEYTESFFNKIIVYTDNQSTGEINLNPVYPNNNLTKKNDYWNFSKLLDISKDKTNKKLFLKDWDSIKNDYYIDKVVNIIDLDINKDWYNKKRFKSKTLNVRLIKDNIENNKFTINFSVLNYRPSFR